MARKIQVVATGGSGKLVTSLPLLSSVPVTFLTAENLRTGHLTQASANQFMYAVGGSYITGNQLGFGFLPFQVSDSGSITLGTVQYAWNTSGINWSSTNVGEPVPGRIAAFGRHDQNGSYGITSYGGVVNAATNTVTVGRAFYADFGATYLHPGGSNTAIGTGTGATVYNPGYNNSSYSGYNEWTYNGTSHYTYSNTNVLNSYSSSTLSVQAMQDWSDSQGRCGIMADHRSAAGGFYWREYHPTGSTNLGLNASVFGRETNASSTLGFRFPSKACYLNSINRYCVTDGQGTLLRTQGVMAEVGFNTSSSLNLQSAVPLGSGYYAAASTSGDCWTIFKPSLDASNNLTIAYAASLFCEPVLPRPVTSRICWDLAGTQRNLLVVVNAGQIQVYDAASLKARMV